MPKQTAWRNRIIGHGDEAPDQLLANPRNWRVHPKAQQDALAGVLNDVGWVQPVLVNKQTGFVVDGHLRVAMAISHGDKSIPVTYVDLTEAEEAEVLATFDPLGALAVADKEQLDGLLREVQSGEAAVQGMLAELAEKSGLKYGDDKPAPDAQIDKAAELQEKWQTATGQLWQVGEHRILCGDSTKAEDVQRVMGGEKAQLVFTDPPYGVDYDGGTKVRQRLEGDATTSLYEPCCQIAFDNSDDQAALYLWHAGIKGIAAAAAAAAAGYEIRCEIVWNKNQAQFGALSAQYKQKHEPAYYCYKRGKAPRWFGPTNEVTVWDVDRAPVNEWHPTQKPVELAQRAMNNSSEQGQIVLDLFLGSGATICACERLHRKGRGIEISPAYVAVCLERLSQMGLTPVLLS